MLAGAVTRRRESGQRCRVSGWRVTKVPPTRSQEKVSERRGPETPPMLLLYTNAYKSPSQGLGPSPDP